MEHCVYILQSERSGRYYVGCTDDVERRLFQHNHFTTGFTARYRPWRLKATFEFSDRVEALAFERKIKGWKSRKMIELLLDGKLSRPGDMRLFPESLRG